MHTIHVYLIGSIVNNISCEIYDCVLCVRAYYTRIIWKCSKCFTISAIFNKIDFRSLFEFRPLLVPCLRLPKHELSLEFNIHFFRHEIASFFSPFSMYQLSINLFKRAHTFLMIYDKPQWQCWKLVKWMKAYTSSVISSSNFILCRFFIQMWRRGAHPGWGGHWTARTRRRYHGAKTSSRHFSFAEKYGASCCWRHAFRLFNKWWTGRKGINRIMHEGAFEEG